jgi:hypothetical protein
LKSHQVALDLYYLYPCLTYPSKSQDAVPKEYGALDGMCQAREDEAFTLLFSSAWSVLCSDTFAYVETAIHYSAAYQARKTEYWHTTFDQSEDNLEGCDCSARRNPGNAARQEAIDWAVLDETLLFRLILLVTLFWHLELV